MALPVDRHPRWFENLGVTAVRRAANDSTWTPVTGARADPRPPYHPDSRPGQGRNPSSTLSVEARAYDEGVALR